MSRIGAPGVLDGLRQGCSHRRWTGRPPWADTHTVPLNRRPSSSQTKPLPGPYTPGTLPEGAYDVAIVGAGALGAAPARRRRPRSSSAAAACRRLRAAACRRLRAAACTCRAAPPPALYTVQAPLAPSAATTLPRAAPRWVLGPEQRCRWRCRLLPAALAVAAAACLPRLPVPVLKCQGTTLATCRLNCINQVALLDKEKFPRDKICGDAVCTPAIHILEVGAAMAGGAGCWLARCRLALRPPAAGWLAAGWRGGPASCRLTHGGDTLLLHSPAAAGHGRDWGAQGRHVGLFAS